MTKQPPQVRVVTGPAELPVFARPASPLTHSPQAVAEGSPGRVRSTFVFASDTSGPFEADFDGQPEAGAARPWIVQGAGSATGLDWGLVRPQCGGLAGPRVSVHDQCE